MKVTIEKNVYLSIQLVSSATDGLLYEDRPVNTL